MMIRTVFPLLIIGLFLAYEPLAQTPLQECGTPPYKSDWLQSYQESPWMYTTRGNDLLTIPLTVHILGTDEGNGFYSELALLDDICKLNQDFDQVDVQFYIREINYISNSDWYNHETFTAGKQMMYQNNVPGSINCYIVGNPAGNCGYYTRGPDAVALNKGCLGENGSTWSHELGHFFTLPHTFLGWEGRDYDPTTPTPNTVGNHNRPVEKVDGSNCDYAADGFCDTGPDYLSYRWNCSNDNMSPVIQRDPDSMQFRSDGRFFMSYSSGTTCRTLFSEEQINAMRANILDQRPGLPDPDMSFAWDEPMRSELVHPLDDTVQHDEVTFRWSAADEAEYYLLQLSILPSMSVRTEYIIEGDTTFQLEDAGLFKDKTYYWEVKPFSPIHTCVEDGITGSFHTRDEATAINDPSESTDWNIFPNPAKKSFTVQFDQSYDRGVLELRSLNGVLINRWPMHGQHSKTIDVGPHPKGLYLISFQSEGEVFTQKFIIE